jgi:hypothetical protein
VREGADGRGPGGSGRRKKGRGLTHGPGLAATEKEERGEEAGPAEERRAGLLGREREESGRVRKQRPAACCCPWAGKRKWVGGGK